MGYIHPWGYGSMLHARGAVWKGFVRIQGFVAWLAVAVQIAVRVRRDVAHALNFFAVLEHTREYL